MALREWPGWGGQAVGWVRKGMQVLVRHGAACLQSDALHVAKSLAWLPFEVVLLRTAELRRGTGATKRAQAKSSPAGRLQLA